MKCFIERVAYTAQLTYMAESGNSQKRKSRVVAIIYVTAVLYYNHSRLHMIQHQAEIFFLLYYFFSFLVEYAAQSVQCLVESASDKTCLVKTEVELLVLDGVKHI